MSTIGIPFGSQMVVNNYGFYLNNVLIDFSSKCMINCTQIANDHLGGLFGLFMCLFTLQLF